MESIALQRGRKESQELYGCELLCHKEVECHLSFDNRNDLVDFGKVKTTEVESGGTYFYKCVESWEIYLI